MVRLDWRLIFVSFLLCIVLFMTIILSDYQEKKTLENFKEECTKPEYDEYYEEDRPLALCYWKLYSNEEDVEQWQDNK